MIAINPNENNLKQVDQLIHQLYQTTRVMSKMVNRSLESTNIYSSEWTILRTVHDRGTMTQTMLANYLNIEPAAISKSLRQLEGKELITRRPGSDKREKYIYLTEQTLKHYNEWSKIVEMNCRRVWNALTPAEQKTLSELLQKVRNKFEDIN